MIKGIAQATSPDVETVTDRLSKLTNALMFTGLTFNESQILIELAISRAATSQEIETRTGMRQPDVSLALKGLTGRGWIERTRIPRSGKGRPMTRLSLTKTFDHIIADIELSEFRKVDAIRDNADKIRRIAEVIA